MMLVDYASFCVIWACRHQVGLVVVVAMMLLLMRLVVLVVLLVVVAAVMTNLRNECLLDNNWHHVVVHHPLVLSRGVEVESDASLLFGRVVLVAAAPMTECLADWNSWKKLHRNLSRPKMEHCKISWPSPSSWC